MNKLQGNITPVGLESVRTELTQLNARFNSAYTSAKKFETELKNDNGAEKLAQKVDLLTSRIKAYQTANSKANKTYGSQFTEMLNQLNILILNFSQYYYHQLLHLNLEIEV